LLVETRNKLVQWSLVYCVYLLCVLQASDNSASKNVANDGRDRDDDDEDPQSFSETF